MNANSSPSLSLSRTERRDEVRRLYFRCQLPMQRIAGKLGVSRYTVWRDVQWWQERMPDLSNPDSRHNLTEILREMDDLKTGAWRAWEETRNAKGESRNERSGAGNELSGELAKKGTPDAATELAANRKVDHPRSSSDASLISAMTRLLAQQAKLVALVEDRAAKAEEEKKSGANVVLYLPDNGRDRHLQPGISSVERATSGEFRTRGAGDSDRSRRSNEADAGAGRLDGGGLAGSANPAADNRAPSSVPLLTSGATGAARSWGPRTWGNETDRTATRDECSRRSNEADVCAARMQSGWGAAPTNPSASQGDPSSVPLLTSGATGAAQCATVHSPATKLQQNETVCNGQNTAQSDASNADINTCKPPISAASQTSVTPATPAPVAESPRYRARHYLATTNEEWLRKLGGERLSLFD